MSNANPRTDLGPAIEDLYEDVAKIGVAPGSFGLPLVFPGIHGPTGYAVVFRKLSESRRALLANERARAERLYWEARTQYVWCQQSLGWITGRFRSTLLPNWMAIILYQCVWIGAAAWIGTTRAQWDLMSVPVPYLCWGTIGAGTAGIFGVWIHRVRADFDPSYLPWYIAKPLIGGTAGAVVFFLGDIVTSVNLSSEGDEAGTTSTAKLSLFVVAFVIGFFESLFVNVLEVIRLRVRDTLNAALGGSSTKEDSSEASAS